MRILLDFLVGVLLFASSLLFAIAKRFLGLISRLGSFLLVYHHYRKRLDERLSLTYSCCFSEGVSRLPLPGVSWPFQRCSFVSSGPDQTARSQKLGQRCWAKQIAFGFWTCRSQSAKTSYWRQNQTFNLNLKL